MSGDEAVDVAVIGAGVTGLSAAYTVSSRRPELGVRVLESRDRAGGNIRTERVDGFLLDAGPDSFLRTKPHAVDLCRELGLESEFLTTRAEARSVYIAHDGELEKLPAGMVLAVPTRLGPMLKTRILSLPAKLRVLGDVFLPKRKADDVDDESISAFLTRRFGAEAAERIGAPLLGGIYAGDIGTLSMRATFPQLTDLEDRWGSVIYGLFAAQLARREAGSGGAAPKAEGVWARSRAVLSWMRRESDHAPSPFVSLRGGLGTLIDRLAERLPAGALRTGVGVEAVEREGTRFRVRTSAGSLIARAVILAAPAHAAARMLPLGKLSSEVGSIPYVSTATVFFALDESALSRPLDGVGFIVPPGEGRILAGTWISTKWEGRAPNGQVLMRAFIGGARSGETLQRSDDEVVALAREELERLMGRFGDPLFTRVYRYENSNPQPTVGHPERLRRIDAELGALPGLALAGAAYDGVGIPDCVRQARAAAEAVLARL